VQPCAQTQVVVEGGRQRWWKGGDGGRMRVCPISTADDKIGMTTLTG